MKWTWFAVSLSLAAAAGPRVIAQPHRHAHRHVERRSPDTEIVYELDGKIIKDKAFVEKGLKDGTLVKVGDSVKLQDPPPSPAVTPTSTPTPTPSPSPSPQVQVQVQVQNGPAGDDGKTSSSSSSSSGATTTTTTTPSTSSSPADQPSPPAGGYGGDQGHGGHPKGRMTAGPSVHRDFPDGRLDCSQFPSEYGAVPIAWTDLGGWTGLQQVVYTDDGRAIKDIHTMKSGPCADGMMCSYACPSGYEKAQWPRAQGTTGQSVGGIECKNGKLHLPHGSTSRKLCRKGYGGIQVQNKVGKPIAVCRTDYPGTESMTIPASMDITSSEPYELTCPDAAQTYRWQNKATSAQYYVNPAGTSLEEACTWNKKGSNKGNFAPVNIGLGHKDGSTWLSIFPNAPTNPDGKLSYNIRIRGGNIECKYENGQYWEGSKVNPKGCTTKAERATFEFY